MRKLPVCALLLVLSLSSAAAAAQEQADINELKKTAVKVYLDCGSCDVEYIKTEITFVNYVRDRLEAQVHILITTQSTGGGGREYTLTFLGQNDFKDVQDVQKYFSNKTDTEDDIRRGLVKALKMGLLSYVGRTPIAKRVAVEYAPPEKAASARDRWNYWVFSFSGDGFFMGEESLNMHFADFSFSANRVTAKSKIRLGLNYDRARNKYEVDEGTIVGVRESGGFSSLFVKSLGEHWSAGFYLSAESNLYSNLDLAVTAAPAVEFNAFPYSQSTRRQLRFLYRLSLSPVWYHELTQSGKTRQVLFRESLSVTLDLREKWGTVSIGTTGSHYFHNFGAYRVNLFGIVRLNVYKGLSIFVLGGPTFIHDQLSLRQREPTYEEQLLRLVELPMKSSYFFSVGFSFTFGSIFTNVINPRFGTAGGGGLRIHID